MCEDKKCCGNCTHYNPLPGFEKTGTCDSVTLGRRSNVPAVLVAYDDNNCWEWEADKYSSDDSDM